VLLEGQFRVLVQASARFGLVTVARRSQMAFLSEIRSLMDRVFEPLRT